MEKKCLTIPNGGTIRAGKRDSLQNGGGSLSHQLPGNQLPMTVRDDATVIYSYTDGEFVPAIRGSRQKSNKKDVPECDKSCIQEPPEYSMKSTESRIALRNADMRIKINQATQTRHWQSRPRAVQCCCFPDSEDSEILNQRDPLSSSVTGWCHRADHHEMLLNGSLGDQAAGYSQNCFACVEVLDRLLFHSNERDVLFDFKYWNDPADAIRPNEGTLLPLWKFPKPDSINPRTVTALAWNPVHEDLLAVGYGDFKSIGMNYGRGGAVALHSLLQPCTPYGKNIVLPAGVLCLAFHPQNAHLLTIGCSNGSIHICDCRESTLVACATVGLLLDAAITCIRWLENSFLASSMNGQVTEWMLTESSPSTGISLELVDSCSLTTPSRPLASQDLPAPDEPSHQFWGDFPAPILCFDIDQFKNSLIMGNQDGSIVEVCIPSWHHRHRNGHDGPVVSVACREASLTDAGMNTSAHIAILTASADWTVRLWDATATGQMEESETFDLGAPVADVAWSPACSTIFGAVSESGIVHIYDMAKDVRTALCTQRIVSSTVTLTRLAFNPLHHGIMVVGDGRGCVHCFKLSPNLRGCNNAGVATEARQGLRTVVTRRKKSAGKTESKDKNLDDTPAVASQMEPLLQVLGKARLRREVVTTLNTRLE